MRANRKALLYTLAFAGALLLVLLIVPSTSNWLRAKEFEWKARSKMDPAKLQDWATNLLQRFPAQRAFYIDLRGTNLPPGMEKIKGYRPMVSIVVGEENAPRVVLFGSLGEPAILIGPANFISTSRETRIWKPGIYFREAHY